MKIKKSELRTLEEEVMAEAPKQDPKKMDKRTVVGPRKNQTQINKLYAGANGFSGLINKLDTNIAALVKAKAISAASAKVIRGKITSIERAARLGYRAEEDKHKRGK